MASIKMQLKKDDLIKLKKDDLIKLSKNKDLFFVPNAKKSNIINGLLGLSTAYLKINKTNQLTKRLFTLKKSNLIQLGINHQIFFHPYTLKSDIIHTLSNISPEFVDKPKVKKTKFKGFDIMRYINMIYVSSKRRNIYSPIHNNKINTKFLVSFDEQYLGYINNDMNSCSTTHIDTFVVDDFKTSKKQFLALCIVIKWDEGQHLNVLIYNKNTKQLEYFEPYGIVNNPNYVKKMRKNMVTFIKNDLIQKGLIIDNIHYVIENDVHGPQFFNSKESPCLGDPIGFCQVWCFWFMNYRAKHNNTDARILIKNFLTQFNKKPFKTFIRNYAEQVVLFMKYHVPICKITSNNIDKSCINSLKKLHSKSIT